MVTALDVRAPLRWAVSPRFREVVANLERVDPRGFEVVADQDTKLFGSHQDRARRSGAVVAPGLGEFQPVHCRRKYISHTFAFFAASIAF